MSNLPEDTLLAMSAEAFNGWANSRQNIIDEIEAAVESKMKEVEVLRGTLEARRKELRAGIAARKAAAEIEKPAPPRWP